MLSVKDAAHVLARLAAPAAMLACTVSATTQIPRIVWEVALQSSQHDYELRGAAQATDASAAWVGVAARPRGRLGAPEQMLVTSISAKGVAGGHMTDLAGDSRLGALVARHALQGMAVGADGQLLMGLSLRMSGATLAVLGSPAGGVADVRPLTFEAGTPEIARFIQLNRNRMMTIGTLGTRPFVAELDGAGKVVWQRALAEDNVNLDSGAPTADGGAVVTGRKGTDPATTRVWLAKLSPKGEVERRAEFDGWLGSVAQGSDGGYLLVTVGRGREAKVTLIGLTASLQQRWATPMPTGQPTTPNFDVAAIPGGDFVVAGVKDRGLWLARVGSSGALRWTEARTPKPPAMETAVNVELFSRSDAFTVLYTVFATEGKEQRQFVRAMRFEP